MLPSRRGFTLIELVMIVGVILILASATITALDPLKRGAQARNSRRGADIESISKASALRIARAEPLSVDYDPATWQMIGTATEGCDMLCGGGSVTEPECFDIAPDLQRNDYLSRIPFDPKAEPNAEITGYAINRVGGSIVTRACNAEGTGPMASGEPPLIEVAH